MTMVVQSEDSFGVFRSRCLALLSVAKYRCHDLTVCFYFERTETHSLYSNFKNNHQTFVIFLQSITLSTTFSLTIWCYGQYLLLFLSSKLNTASPWAVLSHWLVARCDGTTLPPLSSQLSGERREDRARGAVL